MDTTRHFEHFCAETAATIVNGVCLDWDRLKRCEDEVRQRYSSPTDAELDWLIRGIDEPAKSWFISLALEGANSLDERFLTILVTAGVNEIDPSNNKRFILPAVQHFGHRRVMETLVAVIRSGNTFQQAGAINALYWAKPGLSWQFAVSKEYTVENATPESREVYLEVADLRQEITLLLLDLFLSTESIDVQRSIIPSLTLDKTAYPDSHHPLVDRAIEHARAHDDDYIRHRVEVQLGNADTLLALPHRAPDMQNAK
ncbi:MAG: hypothetical protein HQ581_23935 [Planctomycetes bacterium]|nr:hypothetical protein [Planctomycetota bacterium]